MLRAEGLAEALAKEDDDDSRKLRARCLLRVGDWKLAQQDATPRQQKDAADAFRAAASLDGSLQGVARVGARELSGRAAGYA